MTHYNLWYITTLVLLSSFTVILNSKIGGFKEPFSALICFEAMVITLAITRYVQIAFKYFALYCLASSISKYAYKIVFTVVNKKVWVRLRIYWPIIPFDNTLHFGCNELSQYSCSVAHSFWIFGEASVKKTIRIVVLFRSTF